MTADGYISAPEGRVTEIYDPEKVIDFLCSLQDRSIIQYLEMIGHGDHPAIIIHRGERDGFYTLVLFNYPPWMRPEKESPGKVAVYAWKNLKGMLMHFYKMREQLDPSKKAVINDIIFVLHKKEEEARLLPPLTGGQAQGK